MAQRLIALEMGETQARWLVVESSLRQSVLVAAQSHSFSSEDMPEERLHKLSEVLPSDVDTLVVALDGKETSSRLLRFPFSDQRRLDAAVSFELEGVLPWPIEDVFLTWSLAHQEDGQSYVLGHTTRRDRLMGQLSHWMGAGFAPRGLYPASAVIGNLALDKASSADADEGMHAVIAVDVDTTQLAIKQGKRLVYARTLRRGVGDIDAMIASRYDLGLEEASEIRQREAAFFESQANISEEERKLSNVVEEGTIFWLADICASLRSLPFSALLKEIHLVGVGASIPGLCTLASQKTDLPCVAPKLSELTRDIEVGDVALDPEFAVPLALACEQVAPQASGLNLRQRDFAYQGDWHLYQTEWIRFGIGISVVFALAIAAMIVQIFAIDRQENALDQGFCRATKRIVGREICDPTAALATMNQRSYSGDTVSMPRYSASMLFETLSQKLDTALDVNFSDVEFRIGAQADEPDRISGKGQADGFETIEKVIRRLKSDVCVTEAELSKQRRTRNSSRVEFNFSVALECPEDILPGEKLKPQSEGEEEAAASPDAVKKEEGDNAKAAPTKSLLKERDTTQKDEVRP